MIYFFYNYSHFMLIKFCQLKNRPNGFLPAPLLSAPFAPFYGFQVLAKARFSLTQRIVRQDETSSERYETPDTKKARGDLPVRPLRIAALWYYFDADSGSIFME